jgi:hypothetical protein
VARRSAESAPPAVEKRLRVCADPCHSGSALGQIGLCHPAVSRLLLMGAVCDAELVIHMSPVVERCHTCWRTRKRPPPCHTGRARRLGLLGGRWLDQLIRPGLRVHALSRDAERVARRMVANPGIQWAPPCSGVEVFGSQVEAMAAGRKARPESALDLRLGLEQVSGQDFPQRQWTLWGRRSRVPTECQHVLGVFSFRSMELLAAPEMWRATWRGHEPIRVRYGSVLDVSGAQA